MKSPFPKVVYKRNADIYKILANLKRLEILNILKMKEFSVKQLWKIFKLPKKTFLNILPFCVMRVWSPRGVTALMFITK